jgi:hypothetical protein
MAGSVEPARKPVETWAEEKRTPAWLLAAARVHENWPVGRELTEAEFDTALKRVASVRLGY